MINQCFKNMLSLLITFKPDCKFEAGIFCLQFANKEIEVDTDLSKVVRKEKKDKERLTSGLISQRSHATTQPVTDGPGQFLHLSIVQKDHLHPH